MYLAFTRMLGEGYRRRLRSLFVALRVLSANSLPCEMIFFWTFLKTLFLFFISSLFYKTAFPHSRNVIKRDGQTGIMAKAFRSVALFLGVEQRW